MVETLQGLIVGAVGRKQVSPLRGLGSFFDDVFPGLTLPGYRMPPLRGYADLRLRLRVKR
jgi:hypothetical protein